MPSCACLLSASLGHRGADLGRAVVNCGGGQRCRGLRGGAFAPAGAATAPWQGLRTPRGAAGRALQDPQRRSRGGWGREFAGQAVADQGGGVVDGRRQAGRECAQYVRLRGAPLEPLRHQRGERRAVGLGEGQDGRRPAEGGQEDTSSWSHCGTRSRESVSCCRR
ncbi:hypothetical protein SAFG77S_01816 [Streptomyces afghaniensis]